MHGRTRRPPPVIPNSSPRNASRCCHPPTAPARPSGSAPRARHPPGGVYCSPHPAPTADAATPATGLAGYTAGGPPSESARSSSARLRDAAAASALWTSSNDDRRVQDPDRTGVARTSPPPPCRPPPVFWNDRPGTGAPARTRSPAGMARSRSADVHAALSEPPWQQVALAADDTGDTRERATRGRRSSARRLNESWYADLAMSTGPAGVPTTARGLRRRHACPAGAAQ